MEMISVDDILNGRSDLIFSFLGLIFVHTKPPSVLRKHFKEEFDILNSYEDRLFHNIHFLFFIKKKAKNLKQKKTNK